MKQRFTAAFCCALACASMAFAAESRVFDCDAPVQSQKRGICENHLSADDFAALAPGVSWFYNWHYKTDDVPADKLKMDFIPMCWGDMQDRLDGLDQYLSTHKARAVFAINEPNLKGQAFIPPEQTAQCYQKIKAIADKYHLTVVGPHMALGSGKNDSITAMDPIEKKQVTYGFMVPFLKAFMYYVKPTEVGPLAFHGYGDAGELGWAVGVMTKVFNKPVWVTEYAWWKASNDGQERTYLVQSTDMLERTPAVQGYAWFKERVDKNHKLSLLEKESGKLTPLGQVYVNMPVHDADVYYRIPGKLSAGRYVTMQDMQILPGDEGSASFIMDAQKPNAGCDYNLHVESAGQYTIKIKASGAESIIVEKTGITLQGKGGRDWTTLQTKLQLPAGDTALRFVCTAKGQRIESIEFVK